MEGVAFFLRKSGGVAFNCCIICISIIWFNGWHDARNPRRCIISLDMLHFILQCLTMLDYLLC
jgi:hypothetical protein